MVYILTNKGSTAGFVFWGGVYRKAKVAEKVTNVRRASLKKTREAVDRGLREAEMLADSDEDDPASTQTIKVWCPRGDVDNVSYLTVMVITY